ncbi:hypothetical protein ACFL23_03920 [Patescibacteria group bacterium]
MRKKYFYIFGICFISIVILGLVVFFIILLKQKSVNSMQIVEGEKFKNLKLDKKTMNSVPIVGVEKFGNLKLGGETISGQGGWTLAPYMEIPASKFYVTGIQDEIWCIIEECGLDGAFIQTMGGWLQMDTTIGSPDIKEEAGFNLPENKNIKSIVLIGDQDGKIAGIYPSKGLDDVIAILKLHPDLADFNLLQGVNKFGSFKIGEFAPLKPGDPIIHLSEELSDFSTHVPKDKKFYLYSLQKRKYKEVGMYELYENEYVCFISGCRYPDPDPPHDFLFDYIDKLGGWFLSNDENNSEMVKLFGLNQEEVLSGKSSLVILTDEKGVIQAIHPNKTMSDALTILSQHPDLADFEGWYKH